MILVELENYVGKDVDVLVSGHFFQGRIIEADAATNTVKLQVEDDGVYLVDVEAIAMIKV